MNHEQYVLGKSLNKDWTRGRIKHVPHQPTLSSDKKNRRAKSACSRLNDRRSTRLPEDDSEDEVSDAVREFRLTLQLFKRLTQQVREVNQCTNLNRVYNFKHYLVSERSVSPAVRRSQLAAIMSRREIPATGAPHEPICDLGPSTLITRPCSRQGRETRTPSASAQLALATQSKSATTSTTTTTTIAAPVRRPLRPKSTNTKPIEQKLLAEAASLADAKAKEQWQDEDPDFEELFVPHMADPEVGARYSYHDPYPETWVYETVEGACFRGSKSKDPFMLRIAEFEKLQEETVLWETYKEEKNKQSGEASTGKAQASKVKQSVANGNGSQAARVGHRGYSSSNRSQSARVGSSFSRAKSPNNKLRQSWSASKTSSSTNNNHISGDESSDSVLTFRNSGYKLGVSFVPGSMYPEARGSEKASVSGQNGKSLSCSQRLNRNASPVLEENKFFKRLHCETCQAKTTAARRHSCPKHTGIASTPRALRTQYESKASEYYDIVEIARTFEPPCKAQISRARLRPRASVHEKAAVKGLSPGKSYFSQRRISLSCGENMTVRGVSPLNKTTRPSTGRCKSLKKTAKRR